MAQRSSSELNRKILRALQQEQRGASFDKLAASLRIKKGERARFLLILSRMEQAGAIARKKDGRYTASESAAVPAKIISMQRGYGFARPDDGGDDVFVPGRDLGEALPGDKVLLSLESGDSRGPKGRVLSIREQGGRIFTGRLMLVDEPDFFGHAKPKKPAYEVVPDALIRFALPVLRSKEVGAQPGEKVRFSVEVDRSGELAARIITSYGSADSARVCADAIVDAAGIPHEFSEEVRTQAIEKSDAGITPADLEGRADYRDWTIFTIDGHDAKDLDDAISLDAVGNGWRLGVHIADVSHYVRENTVLDKEARNRGTSVYFADRVIPMLPEEISNGICSLNAGEDKLTLSCIMMLDQNGVCTDAAIQKAVIHSKVRGVYREVNALFDGTADDTVVQKYAPVWESLDHMRALAAKLRKAAEGRGTMDLISSEPIFTLDEQGHPVDIQARIPGESEGVIEQLMIAANVAVAALARKRGLPFVYRIHEQPNPEKLSALGEIAQRLGFKTIRYAEPMDLRVLMEEARETPYARLISDRLLRSMAKARYSDSPLGHYGLSLADYCHFTSPIRRYPDLSIHRILSRMLTGMSKDELQQRYASFAHDSAELSSEYEIRAMQAERDCEACYKAEYMGRFIGEVFNGIISSVSPFGLFVELPNAVEGLVRMEDLPGEELRFDEVASMTDRRGKPVYTVGDAMTIRVIGADVSTGRVDFEPVAQENSTVTSQ